MKTKLEYLSSKLKDLLEDLSVATSRFDQGERLAVHDTMYIAFSNEIEFLISHGVHHPS